MPFPLIILAAKGIAVLAKAVVVAKKTTVVAKALVVTTQHYGAATVFSNVIFVSTVVGGVHWTSERFNDVKEMYSLYEANDRAGLFKKFGSLLSKVNTLGITPHSLADSVGNILKHHGMEKALNISGFLKTLHDIASEMK